MKDIFEDIILRQDSVAYRIKEHFDASNMLNPLLMKYDNGKLLISKKQFKHLLELVNSVNVSEDYELEFVDELKY
jgi:hypothetical protein